MITDRFAVNSTMFGHELTLGHAYFKVDQYGRWWLHGIRGPNTGAYPQPFIEIVRQASNLMRPGQMNLPSRALAHFGCHRFGSKYSAERKALLEFYADELNRIFFQEHVYDAQEVKA